MEINGVTLFLFALFLAGVMSIAWILTGMVFKNSPKTAYHNASWNLLLGTWFFLYVQRGNIDMFFSYIVCDITLLLACFTLRRGIEHFNGVKKEDFRHLIFMLITLLFSISARYTPGGTQIAVVATCFFSSVSLYIGANQAYSFMSRDFSIKHCLVILSPIYIMATLLFMRVVLTIILPEGHLDLRDASQFNTSFLAIMILAIIGFNGSTFGLVISRLISKIRHLTVEDSLTETFNRRHITDMANKEIKKMEKKGSEFSIIMLDIDHFKKVNDTYGHATGDAALVTCANLLKNSVRSTDYVGRLGGEEFCIMLPNTNLREAHLLAERIRMQLEHTSVIFEGKTIPITASFGVATLTEKGEWSDLLNQADVAMYRAKKNGRNQVILASALI